MPDEYSSHFSNSIFYTMTKINKILIERGLTQTDLFNLIQLTGKNIGKDRISRFVSGRQTNMHIDTIKVFAKALGVAIDEIVD
jgi:DNA-binding Xre family transcriptional regulator